MLILSLSMLAFLMFVVQLLVIGFIHVVVCSASLCYFPTSLWIVRKHYSCPARALEHLFRFSHSIPFSFSTSFSQLIRLQPFIVCFYWHYFKYLRVFPLLISNEEAKLPLVYVFGFCVCVCVCVWLTWCAHSFMHKLPSCKGFLFCLYTGSN